MRARMAGDQAVEGAVGVMVAVEVAVKREVREVRAVMPVARVARVAMEVGVLEARTEVGLEAEMTAARVATGAMGVTTAEAHAVEAMQAAAMMVVVQEGGTAEAEMEGAMEGKGAATEGVESAATGVA